MKLADDFAVTVIPLLDKQFQSVLLWLVAMYALTYANVLVTSGDVPPPQRVFERQELGVCDDLGAVCGHDAPFYFVRFHAYTDRYGGMLLCALPEPVVVVVTERAPDVAPPGIL